MPRGCKPGHKPANLVKKAGTLSKKTKAAIELVVDKGVEPKTALMMVTGNTNPHPNTITQFKAKCESWSLRHPKNLKLASQTLTAFAAGKDVNGIKPKASDVKAAAERIVDASEPIIKRSESININIDCPVDLSRYCRALD